MIGDCAVNAIVEIGEYLGDIVCPGLVLLIFYCSFSQRCTVQVWSLAKSIAVDQCPTCPRGSRAVAVLDILGR